jgi:TM2 domain-containing membrane protein YozV
MSSSEPTQQSPKNAALALICSLVLCGVGQIYNGQVGKGIVLVIGYSISVALIFVGIGFITTPLLWAYGMIDAYRTAEALNRQFVATQKQCPRCAEKVQATAQVCRHCGFQFASTAALSPSLVALDDSPKENFEGSEQVPLWRECIGWVRIKLRTIERWIGDTPLVSLWETFERRPRNGRQVVGLGIIAVGLILGLVILISALRGAGRPSGVYVAQPDVENDSGALPAMLDLPFMEFHDDQVVVGMIPPTCPGQSTGFLAVLPNSCSGVGSYDYQIRDGIVVANGIARRYIGPYTLKDRALFLPNNSVTPPTNILGQPQQVAQPLLVSDDGSIQEPHPNRGFRIYRKVDDSSARATETVRSAARVRAVNTRDAIYASQTAVRATRVAEERAAQATQEAVTRATAAAQATATAVQLTQVASERASQATQTAVAQATARAERAATATQEALATATARAEQASQARQQATQIAAATNTARAQQASATSQARLEVTRSAANARVAQASDAEIQSIAQQGVERANAVWSSVVAKDGRPVSELERVYGGSWLTQVRRSVEDMRRRGQYRTARLVAPITITSVRRVGERRLEVLATEQWDDRIFNSDGSLAQALPGQVEQKYILEYALPGTCGDCWLIVESDIVRTS